MLSLAASTLERLHQLKKTAIGLDKDPDIGKELPVLTFRDLSKEDLEKIEADQAEKWGTTMSRTTLGMRKKTRS